MDFDEMSSEIKAKARECKTPEEIVKLAESEGYELTDEELEAIAGGSWCLSRSCTDVHEEAA